MNSVDRRRRFRRLTFPLFGLMILATPLAAQDFKFGRPHATMAVYAGWSSPRESSDLFSFTRQELTVERGDFAAPLYGAELALRLTERFDVAAGLETASNTVSSESRKYETMDDLPIPQTTKFRRTRLMGSVKAYLFERGRTISELAWVPNRWSPYLGVGAGMTWYDFRQEGDFVDHETLDIFEDRFQATGSGSTLHGMAGVDVSLNEHFLVRGEYRYIRGEAALSDGDFFGFDAIDVSEWRLTLGLAVRP